MKTKMNKPLGQQRRKLAIGEQTLYRGYSIYHEGKREFRIGIYANGLQDAKKIIDWMIQQGCITEG